MSDAASHGSSPASQGTGGAGWEIEFYEDILRRNPDYVEVLQTLGGLYTDSKMYTKGLTVDQRLAMLQKDDPIVQYNLACSYSILRQVDKAFEALAKAIELGYRDVGHMEKDPDLNNIRSTSRYAEMIERIQRRKS